MTEAELQRVIQTGLHGSRALGKLLGVPERKAHLIGTMLNYQSYRKWARQTILRRVHRGSLCGRSVEAIAAQYGYSIRQVEYVKYKVLPKAGKPCSRTYSRQ